MFCVCHTTCSATVQFWKPNRRQLCFLCTTISSTKVLNDCYLSICIFTHCAFIKATVSKLDKLHLPQLFLARRLVASSPWTCSFLEADLTRTLFPVRNISSSIYLFTALSQKRKGRVTNTYSAVFRPSRRLHSRGRVYRCHKSPVIHVIGEEIIRSHFSSSCPQVKWFETPGIKGVYENFLLDRFFKTSTVDR